MTPQLWVHDRKVTQYALEGHQRDAILSVFSAVAAEPGDHAVAEATRVVDKLHSERRWLACGCRRGADEWALLFPRRRESGRVELVRHPQSKHADDCPLRQTRESPAREAVDRAAPVVRQLRYFRGMGDFAQLGNEGTTREDGGGAAERRVANPLPRDLRLLQTLWAAAGYEQIRPEDVAWRGHGPAARAGAADVAAHYQHIRDAAGKFEVSEGVSVTSVAAWTPQAIEWIRQRLATARIDWKGVRPQGFFLGVVDSTEGDSTLVCGAHRIALASPFRQPGRQDTPGPYACVAVIGQQQREGPVCVVSAGIWPVYSKALLCAVDSHLERKGLRLLLEQQRWWLAQRQTRVVIEKPIADLAVGEDFVRPDFLLVRPDGQRVVIEIMGSDDSAYLERKSRTHALMQALPQVRCLLSFHPEKDDPSRFRRLLTAAVLG